MPHHLSLRRRPSHGWSKSAFVPALLVLGLSAPLFAHAAPPEYPVPAAKNPTITLAVDATDAPRKLIHCRMTIPARPGPAAFVYPKWIPGEHGPTGPIDNIAGLYFSAGGQTLAWKRDLYEPYTFHVQVPAGASAVEVKFDFLLSSDQSGFSSSGLTTPKLVNINWNQLVLYPGNTGNDDVNVSASLRLPTGWKHGTALPTDHESADTTFFQTVPLVTLVDSPVLAGQYMKVVPLTDPSETPSREIDMASDSPEALQMPSGQVQAYKNLIKEAEALFGAHHYRDYHFLYTLSNHVASFGLEHHESSDDRVGEDTVVDNPVKGSGDLLSHEYVHSWNGKFRRPYDLYTPNYQVPMRDDLLWVYEGLTEYYGKVLTARCGLWTAKDFNADIAQIAAHFDHEPGREWRPLADTADDAQNSYNSGYQWSAYRRGTDFYDEMVLVWLEADTIIREQTDGKKSLDDFCKRFYGAPSTLPEVKPYTVDDVINGLNAVAPYDWRGFLNARVNAVNPHAPLGGITNGGWTLAYTAKPNDDPDDRAGRRHFQDLTFSLGMSVGSDGSINDILPGSPAALAGLAPAMKIMAVDGREYTSDGLSAAIDAAKTSSDPITLLVENGEFYQTVSVEYHGGAQYAHLERDASKPDLLALIAKPLVTTPPALDTPKSTGPATVAPAPPAGTVPAPAAPKSAPPAETQTQKP